MSSNYNLDEVKLFYAQILISAALIVSVLISITLSYNEILKLENKKALYTNNQQGKVLIFNRSFSVLIAIGFLIINIIEKRNNPNANVQDTKHTNLQIDASIFNLIAGLIVLYVAYDSINNITATDITNPEL